VRKLLIARLTSRSLTEEIKKVKRIIARIERKHPPSELEDFYSPGDESEAILCLEEIGPAWQKHPEAIEWLKSLQ